MTHLLDHPTINQRYFFPRPAPIDPVFQVECDNATLACRYYQPHPGAPTLVFFHGNGEVVADYPEPFLRAFGDLGLNLFLAEYRGYGGSTGEPALVAMLDDVGKIIAATGQPHENLILYGRSLGSYYVTHGAAQHPNVAGLIIESGIADPRERLLLRIQPHEIGCDMATFNAAISETLDQKTKMEAFPGPVLIMHTRHDGLVDLSHAQRNYEWARGPKTLKVFEQGTHNSILSVNATAYFGEISKFVATIFN